MARSTQALIQLLHLERIEDNIYRGHNRDIGSGRIFGGQVLAQALVAARRTIEQEDRAAHSLHGYFILEGDLDIPVVYFVDCLRDGKSFTTRNVTAIQHGRAIFTLSASFHRTETSLSHQAAMPDVPPPEELRSELEIVREAPERIPARLRDVLTQERPLDFSRWTRTTPSTGKHGRRFAAHGSGHPARWATTPRTTRPRLPTLRTMVFCRQPSSLTAETSGTGI